MDTTSRKLAAALLTLALLTAAPCALAGSDSGETGETAIRSSISEICDEPARIWRPDTTRPEAEAETVSQDQSEEREPGLGPVVEPFG